MIPVVSLLVILGISLLVTRSAAVALEHTGLSRDAARFQARSAFLGVGFTTAEAEKVVGDPVRRRIVMWLMLVGNVGVISVIAAVLLSAFDLRSRSGVGTLIGGLFGGLALLWAISSSRWVDDRMCGAIRWAIRRFTTLDANDYVRLLHLGSEYGVLRFRVEENDWISDKTLRTTRLADEGLLVLGIECPGGNFVGAPPADIEVHDGDELIVYGPADRVSELNARTLGEHGDHAHTAAISERQDRLQTERRRARR